MISVCVPSEAVAAALDGLAVQVCCWDWQGAAPDGAAASEFVVPPYMSGPPDPRRLDELPAARVLQLLSAGYEPWEPVLRPGMVLCNGRGIHGASTAELAVGGLIAVLREFPANLDRQRRATWVQEHTDGLAGKRVLVLGAGDIGMRVATAVGAFEAETTLVGRTPREGVLAGADVPRLLADHDVVVVAVPYSAQTHRLVDAAFLAAMPDGAVLVNVARGPIVDTEALLAELRAGRLRAFLDVTDPEPLPDGHPLWTAPNVLITPHIGGGTTGWQQRADALLRAQVARYLAGESLQNVVARG